MTIKKGISIGGLSFALYLSLVLYSCATIPENPYTDPSNVAISLIVPDTAQNPVYSLDTTVIGIVTTMHPYIDSVTIAIGNGDSLFTVLADTIAVKVVFQDSAEISIVAKAYCKRNIIKTCEKKLHVQKNPLAPPDTVRAQPLSDSSIMLCWNTVSVAAKYRVYRSPLATGIFSLVKTVADTLYTDFALHDSTAYYYAISCIDSRNRESEMSVPYPATTFALPLSKWDQMIWDKDKWEQ